MTFLKNKKKKMNLEQEDYEKKITNMHFKRIEELLLAQNQRLEAQSLQAKRNSDPKSREALGRMALRLFELWIEISDFAEEYEVMNIKMLMEGDA
jgi:hypothetical protein